MITYQDFEKATDRAAFIVSAINRYMKSEEYKIALDADEYWAQRNSTIKNFVQKVYDITGLPQVSTVGSNNKIASNFFKRLISARCSYSLGNGVSFTNKEEKLENGRRIIIDRTKEFLGDKFDIAVNQWAIYGERHGKSYMFANEDNGKPIYHVFPMTEFMPLPDEKTGKIRAGLRFWSLEWRKRPVTVEVFTEDGIEVWETAPGKTGLSDMVLARNLTPYKVRLEVTEADGETVVGGTNYGTLPVIAFYANEERQSALVGMKDNIDAFDVIHSGFANDLQDVAQIFWLIAGADGMRDQDKENLMKRLRYERVALVSGEGSTVTPYTQEVPYNARQACLEGIRNSIYENFGALDVHTIAAGSTNDHIDAAYQPVDDEADQFEYQLIQSIQQILSLFGIDDIPTFKRNRISNQKETTETLMLAANYLDDETVIKKLPFISVDEVETIMQNRDKDAYETFTEE